jgi:hypothetical protein
MDCCRDRDGALKCAATKSNARSRRRYEPRRFKSSVEVTDEFDVEAVGAVDVAQEDDRKIALDVVLDLD